MKVRPSREDWNAAALGSIESASWPAISGWVALLDPQLAGDEVRIRIQGFPSIPLRARTTRLDVQKFLGAPGVWGFAIDQGSISPFAATNGAWVTLECKGVDLATLYIDNSPIDQSDQLCSGPIVAEALVCDRLLRGDSASGTHSAVACARQTGLPIDTVRALQWSEYFQSCGFAPELIAAWYAVETINEIGAGGFNPLPENSRRACLEGKGGETNSQDRMNRTPIQDMYAKFFQTDDDVELLASIRQRLNGLSAHVVEEVAAGSKAETTSRPEGLLVNAKHFEPLQIPPVAVAGLIGHRSGLGLNADYSIAALEDQGGHVCLAPFMPRRGGWNSDLAVDEGSARDLGDHVVLLHAPLDSVVQALAVQPSLMTAGRLIGYFMWETHQVPQELHRSLALVDEIWTASEFVADAFRATTNTPVFVTGHAIETQVFDKQSRTSLGISESSFVAHYSFDANSTVARKNPNAAIDAFHLAFGDDPNAVFLLKIRNFQQVEYLAQSGCTHSLGLLNRLTRASNIKLVTEELSRSRTLALMDTADCYISLHRSEGFGYTLAEAIKLGKPVISTAYGGNTDFCTTDQGWLVPFELSAVLPGEYFYWEQGMQWAEPDVISAAEALQQVRMGIPATSSAIGQAMTHTSLQTVSSLGTTYRERLLAISK